MTISPLRFIASMIDHPAVQPEPNSGCWLWTGYLNASGYGWLTKPYGEGGGLAHRVSWEMHNGNAPSGLGILHKCHVRCCVNPDHLYPGTQLDNMRDLRESGRPDGRRAGAKNGRSVLTEDAVKDIRQRRARGETYESLGRSYRVSTVAARNAAVGKTWNHI